MQQPTVLLPSSYNETNFNRGDYLHPKYRCCCSSYHVVHGTKILLIFYTIIVILAMFQGYPTSAVPCTISIAAIGCAAFGLTNERHLFLWPLLFLYATLFSVSLAGSVTFFGLIVAYGPKMSKLIVFGIADFPVDVKAFDPVKLWAIAEIGLVIITYFFFWQLIVLVRCKWFLQERRAIQLCQAADVPAISVPPSTISHEYALANGYDQPPPDYFEYATAFAIADAFANNYHQLPPPYAMTALPEEYYGMGQNVRQTSQASQQF